MINQPSFRQNIKAYYLRIHRKQREFVDTVSLRKGVKSMIKTFPQFAEAKKDKTYLKESKRYLSKTFKGYKNTNWHHFYAVITGRKSLEYIPSDIYFTQIEPALNHLELSPAASDKISYDTIFKKTEIPETLFKIMNNTFYNPEHEEVDFSELCEKIGSVSEDFVLKPAIDSGGGKNVRIESGIKIIELLSKNPLYKTGSFLLQRKIKQSSLMAQFHPNSLNTCRLMTARVNSDIVILSAYLRVGRNNKKIDNVYSGGLICKINDNGKLDKFALTREKLPLEKHPDTNISFENFQIPNYDKVKELCTFYHQKFLRYTFISWDIGINEHHLPVVVELNLKRQTIHGHQILNGPLFGTHISYFIERFYNVRNQQKQSNFSM